jgi:butyrate kinase
MTIEHSFFLKAVFSQQIDWQSCDNIKGRGGAVDRIPAA